MNEVALAHHIHRRAWVYSKPSLFMADSCLIDSSCVFVTENVSLFSWKRPADFVNNCVQFPRYYSCLFSTMLSSLCVGAFRLRSSFRLHEVSFRTATISNTELLLCWWPSNFLQYPSYWERSCMTAIQDTTEFLVISSKPVAIVPSICTHLWTCSVSILVGAKNRMWIPHGMACFLFFLHCLLVLLFGRALCLLSRREEAAGVYQHRGVTSISKQAFHILIWICHAEAQYATRRAAQINPRASPIVSTWFQQENKFLNVKHMSQHGLTVKSGVAFSFEKKKKQKKLNLHVASVHAPATVSCVMWCFVEHNNTMTMLTNKVIVLSCWTQHDITTAFTLCIRTESVKKQANLSSFGPHVMSVHIQRTSAHLRYL